MSYGSMDELIRDLETNPIEASGSVYHPIPFPEFAYLTTSSNAERVHEKLKLIRQTLRSIYPESLIGKTILDIGANGGFYAFSLAQDGAEVTAIEPHPRYAAVGEFLAREKKDLNVKWISESLQLEHLAGRQYDVALLLSVFQWMCEGNNKLEAGKHLLGEISRHVDVLFFELGVNSGKSSITTRKINHLAYIYHLLKASTEYKDVKLVGVTRIWEPSRDKCSFLKRIARPVVRIIRRRHYCRYLFVCSRSPLDIREPWFSFLKYAGV